MKSIIFLQFGFYAAIVVFFVASIGRFVSLWRLPVHLRWELYPIPGREEPGSEFETRQGPCSRVLAEIKYMANEILLFRTHFKLKRNYWYAVYPLHLSIYLLLVWTVLLGFAHLFPAYSFQASPHQAFTGVSSLIVSVGVAGLLVGMLSSAALIYKRVTEKDLALNTPPIIYFNLLLVFAIFLTGFLNWLFWDSRFEIVRRLIFGFLPADAREAGMLNPALSAHIVLLSLFLLYLPLSRMMHFVAKYFIFHKVLWESSRGIQDISWRNEIVRLSRQRTTWSAPHIAGITENTQKEHL